MEIGKYCDMMGAVSDRREWLRLQNIVFNSMFDNINKKNVTLEQNVKS